MTIIADAFSHHPYEYSVTLGSKEVIIREQATNWNAHKIKLTIIWSPEDKVTEHSAEHHKGSASDARKECLKDLEAIVTRVYKKSAVARSDKKSA